MDLFADWIAAVRVRLLVPVGCGFRGEQESLTYYDSNFPTWNPTDYLKDDWNINLIRRQGAPNLSQGFPCTCSILGGTSSLVPKNRSRGAQRGIR